jgi:hypothetical protein
MSKPTDKPEKIPLNIVDRQFLIPETDDDYGAYLPMATGSIFQTDRLYTTDEVRQTLIRINDSLPQLRIGYKLNLAPPYWVRVEEDMLEQHFDRMVETHELSTTINEYITQNMRTNIDPISEPLRVVLFENYICIQCSHVFGDGRFLIRLTSVFLHALYHPDDDLAKTIPFEQNYHFPMGKVVFANPRQSWLVARQLIPRTLQKVYRYAIKTTGFNANHSTPNGNTPEPGEITRDPIRSGSAMGFAPYQISPAEMQELHTIRKNLLPGKSISITNFLQMHFALRMVELGYTQWPIEFTITLDLSRYLNNPQEFYPGNRMSSFSLLLDEDKVPDVYNTLQERSDQLLRSAYALADIPGNWMLAAMGDKAYKQANRQWWVNSAHTESRFFHFVNLGILDPYFPTTLEKLPSDIKMYISLMGGPPLLIGFYTVKNHGTLTFVYDPQVLSLDDIEAIRGDLGTPY